jgi:hypothetical protein
MFVLHLVRGTTFKNKEKKTKVVPGTKYRGLSVFKKLFYLDIRNEFQKETN